MKTLLAAGRAKQKERGEASAVVEANMVKIARVRAGQTLDADKATVSSVRNRLQAVVELKAIDLDKYSLEEAKADGGAESVSLRRHVAATLRALASLVDTECEELGAVFAEYNAVKAQKERLEASAREAKRKEEEEAFAGAMA